tara:strand:+ start:320 stop:1075 length:756 start_codon:yes stop_codon:yes gene_type:complete
MAVNKITGTLFTDIEKLIGVSKASIASVSGVTASTTPAFITANLKSRYTPATYSGTGVLVDTVSGHNITVGGATYSSTQPAHFDNDGVNDYMISSTFTQPNSDLSFGMWMNCDVNATGVMIVCGVTIPSGIGGLIYRASGRTSSYYRGNRGISNVSGNPAYAPKNQWIYMCWSRNASTRLIRMWKCDVNGVTQLVSATGGSSASASNTVNFMTPAQNFFNGQVGNYHVYDDDLGTTEWTQNFNAQKAYYGL